MTAATPDHWEPLTAAWHTRDTEWLQRHALNLRDMAQREDAVQARLGTKHPGWAGQCGRPAVGIIRIILLLRGAEVTF